MEKKKENNKKFMKWKLKHYRDFDIDPLFCEGKVNNCMKFEEKAFLRVSDRKGGGVGSPEFINLKNTCFVEQFVNCVSERFWTIFKIEFYQANTFRTFLKGVTARHLFETLCPTFLPILALLILFELAWHTRCNLI